MKTKKNKNTAARALAPASDPVAAHFALVKLLDQFGRSSEQFFRQAPQCYEHKIAAKSLDDLKKLYCILLQPGKTLEEVCLECPPWPAGKFAGRLPNSTTLGPLRNHLRNLDPETEVVPKQLTELEMEQHKTQLENKKLRLKEKNLQLRNKRQALDRDKFDHQLAAICPSQPALPVSEEDPEEMIERFYGPNPFKN